MNKKDVYYIYLPVLLVGGYFFSFIYAFIIDTVESDFHANMGWVWEHRHDASVGIIDNMIHGAILYLIMLLIIAVFLILDEIKKIKQ